MTSLSGDSSIEPIQLITSKNLTLCTSKYANTSQEGPKTIYKFKVILIGNVYVGKTSIISRFAENQFKKSYSCTIGGNYKVRTINIDESTSAELTIWDTCGDEKYRSITKQYYRDAHSVLIVFDLTDRKTFERIHQWIDDIRDNCSSDIVVMLVGNKNDVIEERKVDYTEGIVFSKKNNIDYIEVSAKTGNNIFLLFERVSDELVKREKDIEIEEKKRDKRKSKTNLISNIKSKMDKKTEILCC